MKNYKNILLILTAILLVQCNSKSSKTTKDTSDLSQHFHNILNYKLTPKHKFDKNGLMFSDQGAWFAFSLSDTTTVQGFSGPLMTQQNGIWAGTSLMNLQLKDKTLTPTSASGYASHLSQTSQSDQYKVTQELVFLSGHTALIKNSITNISDQTLATNIYITGDLFDNGLHFTERNNTIQINSAKTPAKGYLQFLNISPNILTDSTNYTAKFASIQLQPKETKEIIGAITFIFPEYSWQKEQQRIQKSNFKALLEQRVSEKNQFLKSVTQQTKANFSEDLHRNVLAKAILTLQNNWRIPAGEIKHEGLFPSYHYRWFNGFWSWDSWKHASGLAYYDTDLAKKQMKLMFEFQNEDGFVADVVYRDTTIEKHNYRDTKPPLSAWAVAKINAKAPDKDFVAYMYPKLKKYHYWWYQKRDHDQDGLCEYGSTDGSLIAAKWESGMDNAIRFDNSKILKNGEGAYSLDQESVDLNAYLYAEKLYLASLAQTLGNKTDEAQYRKEAADLKIKIQQQFYDKNDGWFYDTNLEGDQFIKGEGSEGWTALWAKVATKEQAAAVKERMLDPKKFFVKVPFQTMSADHPKFDPLKGYWRGPNWLDQAYFGVKGLRNYGFITEANEATQQILKGCEGLLEQGMPIRENYHPLTGKGLHAKNFSWSAAHIIMLLMKDEHDL